MKPVLIATCLVTGAGAVLLLPSWPLHPFWMKVLCVMCCVMLFSTKRYLPKPFVWGALAFVCGASVSIVQLHSALNQRVPDALTGNDVRIRVRIESTIDERPERQVFIAKTLQAPNPIPANRWRIAWYGVPKDEHSHPIAVAVDDEWEFTVRLRGLQGTGNPGGFDVSAWYLRTHVNGVGYVRNDPAPVLINPGGLNSINAWRSDVATRVRGLIEGDAYDAVVVALTLGFRQGIDEDFRQLLIDTGTAHLLAISGLHIGLVSAAAFFFFKLIWGLALKHGGLTLSRTAFAGLSSLCVAAAYAVLAGLSPPTLRAVGMCAIGLWVICQRRSLSIWIPFSATLAAVVLSDVVRLLSAGVWLSFGTVAFIVLLQRPKQSKAFSSLASVWRTHAALGVCVLPLSGWFFSQGSLISPVANLLAVPLVTFVVVPLSLAVVALVNWWPAGATTCLRLVSYAIDILERWLLWCAQLPYSDVPITLSSVLVLVAALVGVLCVCAPASIAMRRFALPLCLPMVVWSMGGRSVEDLELHVLDVGQGHASLLLTKNHVVLVDTGGTLGSGKSHWQATVLPALRRLGRRSIDHVIISHSDSDHAAGAEEIAEQFPKATFWLGGLTQLTTELSAGGQKRRCFAGQQWTLDDVHFSFLYPSSLDVETELIGQNADDNDSSCVLLVQLGRSTVLFPGDIERRGEVRLLARVFPDTGLQNSDAGNKSMTGHKLNTQHAPKALINSARNLYNNATWPQPLSASSESLALQERLTLMVAPHHGSRTSSTDLFVAAWRPEHVLFPAGHRNRLGFPHEEVLMRYKVGGSEPYVTGRDGAILFKLGPSGLKGKPARYWVKHRRLWHTPRG